jgi:hypothetical protein
VAAAVKFSRSRDTNNLCLTRYCSARCSARRALQRAQKPPARPRPLLNNGSSLIPTSATYRSQTVQDTKPIPATVKHQVGPNCQSCPGTGHQALKATADISGEEFLYIFKSGRTAAGAPGASAALPPVFRSGGRAWALTGAAVKLTSTFTGSGLPGFGRVTPSHAPRPGREPLPTNLTPGPADGAQRRPLGRRAPARRARRGFGAPFPAIVWFPARD